MSLRELSDATMSPPAAATDAVSTSVAEPPVAQAMSNEDCRSFCDADNVILPPRRLAGYLWKKSPANLRLRAHQLRFVSIEDGRICWWSSAEESREAGLAGAKGAIDLLRNPFCKVEADAENPTRFRVSPPAEKTWLGGTFTGQGTDRVFEFDLGTYSEHSREQWLDALRKHVQYAAIRSNTAGDYKHAVQFEEKRRAYWVEHNLSQTLSDALEKLHEIYPESPFQFLSGYFTVLSSLRERKSMNSKVAETERWRQATLASVAGMHPISAALASVESIASPTSNGYPAPEKPQATGRASARRDSVAKRLGSLVKEARASFRDAMSSKTAAPETAHEQVQEISRFKVLVVDVHEVCRAVLEPCGTVNIYPKLTEYELVEHIGAYDALVCRSSIKVTEKLLDAAPRLKIIALAQVSSDNIPIELCAQRGIRVCNSIHGNSETTAEHVLALMLATVRKIAAADQSMRDGKWLQKPFLGSQLCASTLGMIGFGKIAVKVARVACAIGMHIMAYDPYADEEKSTVAHSIGVALLRHAEELPKLYQSARILSMHVPLTTQTKGMVGAAEIAMMRPGSYIVNCAAGGGVVDEEAVSEALRSGHLAGAAMDVYEAEQGFASTGCVPNSFCLVSAPNAVLTPRLGGMSAEAQEAVAVDASLQVTEFLIRQVEPKFALIKPDKDNPSNLVDARESWMK